MNPEFIAWDREKKEWVGSHDITMTLNGQIYSHGGIGGLNITDRFDLYPYIGRKDKDGNKVYDGSIIEHMIFVNKKYVKSGGHYYAKSEYVKVKSSCVYQNCKFVYSLMTPYRTSTLANNGPKEMIIKNETFDMSAKWETDKDIKVIGHIAEEATDERNNTA